MPSGNGHKQKLRRDPHNARKHGDRNKAMIRESLEAVGPLRSIGVDGDNVIRAGNGVFAEAEALGLKIKLVDAKPNELVAVRRKDLKGKKAVEAALWDNRAGETSEWDTDILSDLVKRDGDLVRHMFEGERDLLAQIKGEAPEFPEYDESIADGVSVCICPMCGHEHAKKN